MLQLGPHFRLSLKTASLQKTLPPLAYAPHGPEARDNTARIRKQFLEDGQQLVMNSDSVPNYGKRCYHITDAIKVRSSLHKDGNLEPSSALQESHAEPNDTQTNGPESQVDFSDDVDNHAMSPPEILPVDERKAIALAIEINKAIRVLHKHTEQNGKHGQYTYRNDYILVVFLNGRLCTRRLLSYYDLVRSETQILTELFHGNNQQSTYESAWIINDTVDPTDGSGSHEKITDRWDAINKRLKESAATLARTPIELVHHFIDTFSAMKAPLTDLESAPGYFGVLDVLMLSGRILDKSFNPSLTRAIEHDKCHSRDVNGVDCVQIRRKGCKCLLPVMPNEGSTSNLNLDSIAVTTDEAVQGSTQEPPTVATGSGSPALNSHKVVTEAAPSSAAKHPVSAQPSASAIPSIESESARPAQSTAQHIISAYSPPEPSPAEHVHSINASSDSESDDKEAMYSQYTELNDDESGSEDDPKNNDRYLRKKRRFIRIEEDYDSEDPVATIPSDHKYGIGRKIVVLSPNEKPIFPELDRHNAKVRRGLRGRAVEPLRQRRIIRTELNLEGVTVVARPDFKRKKTVGITAVDIERYQREIYDANDGENGFIQTNPDVPDGTYALAQPLPEQYDGGVGDEGGTVQKSAWETFLDEPEQVDEVHDLDKDCVVRADDGEVRDCKEDRPTHFKTRELVFGVRMLLV